MQRLLVLAAVLLSSSVALAIPPDAILPIQGVLTDKSDMPLDGSFDVTFRLYDELGTMFHQELLAGTDALVVDNGAFVAYLGVVQPLDLSAFSATGNVLLGITIGSDTEMPLVQLGLTPYAASSAMCADAEALQGLSPADFASASALSTLSSDVVTGVSPGAGLTGGGSSGDVVLGLADGGVTSAKLADGSVTAAKIANATITGADIDWTNTIATCGAGEYMYGMSSAGVLQCRADQVGTSGGGTITGVTAGTSLTGGGTTGAVTLSVSNGGIGATQLASAAVTSAKLATGAVGTAALADSSVTAAKIANATITGADIDWANTIATCAAGEYMYGMSSAGVLQCRADQVGTSGGGTITGVTAGTSLTGGGSSGAVTLSVSNGGIGATQLASAAVTSAKLATGAVGTAALADSSVTGAKIAGATITGADIDWVNTIATCAAGEYMYGMSSTGVLQCRSDVQGGAGTITGVTAGTGLTGGGSSGAVTVSVSSGGIGAAQLANGAVTAAKLANGAMPAYGRVTFATSNTKNTDEYQNLYTINVTPPAAGLIKIEAHLLVYVECEGASASQSFTCASAAVALCTAAAPGTSTAPDPSCATVTSVHQEDQSTLFANPREQSHWVTVAAYFTASGASVHSFHIAGRSHADGKMLTVREGYALSEFIPNATTMTMSSSVQ